ncbi:MAG TPA: MCE family protein [Nocardioides sp.]|nr:MCE family protein [Nocardioides sp.]
MSRRPTLRSRLARTAALVAAGAVTLTGCDFSVYELPLPGGADLGDDPYAVTVQFSDVLDLVPQSAVKVNDVTVGKVDKVDLDGYTAEVTVLLREDVELPDNAVAHIRQTSLLGEKFVSLSPPETGASTGRLGNGDVIPLDRSGRNPEVEEVLGAMSLLLNGGGVAQLKTISTELNNALEGREANVKSVLAQLDTFMGQLDENKAAIVQAIESLNRLAISLREQKSTINLALDEMPAALESVNRQRDDLIMMLQALGDLSSVGTQVIRDSKVATVDSLEALAPTLTKLAEAGDAFPKSLQVFLTYPFVDAVVGKNPAQARNLHMGDYTNLSIQMEVNANGENDNETDPVPDVCAELPDNPLCEETGPVRDTVNKAIRCIENTRDPANPAPACEGLTLKQLKEACQSKPRYKETAYCQAILAAPSGTPLDDLGGLVGGGDGGGGGVLGGDGGLLRPAFGAPRTSGDPLAAHYDEELAPLLLWGLMDR